MSGTPEILALHGNLGRVEDWTRLGLAGLRAVDLWDFVGLDFHAFAGELAGPLAEGMEKPVLAGYSLGGRLALHAMALFPERWGGAVIASAHPGLCCVEDRLARRTSDAIWAERARTLPWEEFLADWNRQALFGAGSADRLQRQSTLAPRREEVAVAFETWSLAAQEDLRGALRAFSAPVLWIVGEHDTRFAAIGESMAEVFEDFRLLVIPQGGHRVLEEAPEEVAHAVQDLFRSPG